MFVHFVFDTFVSNSLDLVQPTAFHFEMPPENSGPRSLTDRIDIYSQISANDLSILVKSLQHDQEDSVDFARQHRASQNEVKLYVSEDIAFCRRTINVLPRDDEEVNFLSGHDLYLILFPSDHDELYKRCGL